MTQQLQDPFPTGDPSVNAAASVPAAGHHSRTFRGVAIGSLVGLGLAAAALVGPLAVQAASPNPSATTAPATGGTPGTGTVPHTGVSPSTGAPTGKCDGDHGGAGSGPGGFGFGRNETVSDTSVVAKAIGMSEADLKTALQGGQTVAQVAKAHDVEAQKVIDALVQDGLDELAAEVKAGTITQAQADSMKAGVTQRATDQVNGTFSHHH